MSDSSILNVTAPQILQGLSDAEAARLRTQGKGNNIKIKTGRSYWQIFSENVLTFINIILFVLGGALAALGLWRDAALSVGVIGINLVVNIFQEIRAKIKLDKISLLTRPTAIVIRDGKERTIDPTEIVIGDVLVIKAGDQFVVDGRVVGDGSVDVDESQLTGESDVIKKKTGDEVFSGSFCVSGTTYYVAEKVGVDTFVHKVSAGAKSFRRVMTPLQSEIDLVIRLTVFLAAIFGLLVIVNSFIYELPLTESVRVGTVIAHIVPNGLFMMIALAYAMGAVRLAGKGALIQQANAIESLSNVDVLCTDKTGTLTTNRIRLHSLFPFNTTKEELSRLLGTYARSTPGGNKTNEALAEGCQGESFSIKEQIPFSSALKWSALSFDQPGMRGIYVLGAPEMLSKYVEITPEMHALIEAGAVKGLRVLLFACCPEVTPLYRDEKPDLPTTLKPLGIIYFSDILREEARETLEAFAREGISVKVISGDNPGTVLSLAKQAGLPPDSKGISGTELEGKTSAELAQIAHEYAVFGRITPVQKEALVTALRNRGHYVAMMGDGVNDVLSLKKANLGIAMESGSQATRGVADVVLMGDSFAALPQAFAEGNRIRNGMQDIIKLFLVRIFAGAMLLLFVSVVLNLDFFPYTPTQSSFFVLLTVGLPVFGLAYFAPSGSVPRGGIIKSLMHFVIPAAVLMAVTGLFLYLGFLAYALRSLDSTDLSTLSAEAINRLIEGLKPEAQTALITFNIFCGLLLVIYAQPPLKFFVGGDKFSGDWRPTIMAGVILAGFFVVMAIEPFRKLFDLYPLSLLQFLIIAGAALLYGLILMFVWRKKLLDRMLGVNFGGPQPSEW